MSLRNYVLAYLGALTVIAVYVHGLGNVLPQAMIAVVTAAGLDGLLRYSLTGVRANPTNAVITGGIVALLLPEGQTWYVPLVAAALGIGSKHLLRWRGGNVFNPAAVGVAAAVLIFSEQLKHDHAKYLEAAPRLDYAQARLRMEDWSFVLQGGHGWLGSTSAVAVVVLGVLLVRKLRRGELVWSYLLTYVVLFAGFVAFTGQDPAIRLPLEIFATGVPFLVFLMLTDPATSPHTARGRTAFGVFTALLSFVFRFIASPVQFLLYALLVANLVLATQRKPGGRPAAS